MVALHEPRLASSRCRRGRQGPPKTGNELVEPPESFFISRGGPLERQTPEAGEIERAEAWGRAVGPTLPRRS